MSRETVTISMPSNMMKWVRGRIADGEFMSVSDYFRQLVRDDQGRERINAANRHLEARRQEAMASSANLRIYRK